MIDPTIEPVLVAIVKALNASTTDERFAASQAAATALAAAQAQPSGGAGEQIQ